MTKDMFGIFELFDVSKWFQFLRIIKGKQNVLKTKFTVFQDKQHQKYKTFHQCQPCYQYTDKSLPKLCMILLDTLFHCLISATKDMRGILSSILKVVKPVYYVILTMW